MKCILRNRVIHRIEIADAVATSDDSFKLRIKIQKLLHTSLECIVRQRRAYFHCEQATFLQQNGALKISEPMWLNHEYETFFPLVTRKEFHENRQTLPQARGPNVYWALAQMTLISFTCAAVTSNYILVQKNLARCSYSRVLSMT